MCFPQNILLIVQQLCLTGLKGSFIVLFVFCYSHQSLLSVKTHFLIIKSIIIEGPSQEIHRM